MNFETVKKSNKKKIIIGVGVLLVLTSVVTFVGTRAKYKSVQSLKLANGTIDYIAPDLKLAIKVSEDGKTYKSQATIPEGNYTFNSEKSKCRIPNSSLVGEDAPVAEGVTIEYTDGKINVLGVTKKNTRCYVYFDKVLGQTSSSIIAAIEASTSFKSGTPDFTQVATGAETEANNGIYKVSDGMYNGSSYYWRGAATTNHVIFDSKCWRIVRINGDKSIRLIYNGTPTSNRCPGNGSNSSSVVLQNTVYNSSYNNSSYVGWTYSVGNQRPSTANLQTSGTAAPIKTALENWYNSNISAAAKAKVDSNGKFCNDRSTKGNETWRATGDTQYYAGYARMRETYAPTLSCPSGDVYGLAIGAITADEVMFAGGKSVNNTSYYLYTGANYWTMSPSRWYSTWVYVFFVNSNGDLYDANVNWTDAGMRPVINLLPDTLFNASSDGTQNNPYVVLD